MAKAYVPYIDSMAWVDDDTLELGFICYYRGADVGGTIDSVLNINYNTAGAPSIGERITDAVQAGAVDLGGSVTKANMRIPSFQVGQP